MTRTVLVTGGAGFIGSHLVDALVAAGHAVRVLDNLSTGSRRNIEAHGSRIELVDADLAAPGVADAACRDIDTVFHQAAIPSVPRSVKDPAHTQRNGEVATLALLEACCARKVRRVVFAASSSAYGGSDELPKIETMTPTPLSPYAASKLACEHYIAAFAHSRGLDGVSLRYFNVFGPRQDPSSPYSGVISVFLERMRRGQRPPICGDGEQSRDFTYVENVVKANLLAMEAVHPLRGVVCNVGCGERITLKQLVAALNDALGTKLEPEFGPERAGDARHSLADLRRAAEVLGYAPTIGFAEGIRRLVAATK